MILLLLILVGSPVLTQISTDTTQSNIADTMQKKITVEIWSDVVCPFCYIGKRHFESALSDLHCADQIEIEWKSFQLNPDQVTDTSKTIYESLSESKGWSIEQTKSTTAHVTNMAAQAGLEYHFDEIVVANTRQAHRLIQFAKSKNKGNEMEECLFRAHFTEGQNIDDPEVLVKLGVSCGLADSEIREALKSEEFEFEVQRDILEAGQIGVRGVPFFVFDRKYAISGAQPVETFEQALKTLLEQTKISNPAPVTNDGASCDPQGECD